MVLKLLVSRKGGLVRFGPLLFGLAASWMTGSLLAQDELLYPISKAEQAPAFDLATPDGTRIKLADYRGDVVVVNFWATWCPPCLAEMPSMERASQQLREQGVRFVAINVDEDAATVAAFSQRSRVTFPLLVDPGGKVSETWPLEGIPTTFVVAPDGTLRLKAEGERDWDSLPIIQQLQTVRQLTGQSAAVDVPTVGFVDHSRGNE